MGCTSSHVFHTPLSTFLTPSEGTLSRDRYRDMIRLGTDGEKRKRIDELAFDMEDTRTVSCPLLFSFSIKLPLPAQHMHQTQKSRFGHFWHLPGQTESQKADSYNTPALIAFEGWPSTSTATADHTPSPSSSPPSHDLHNVIHLLDVKLNCSCFGEDDMPDLEYIPDLELSPTSSLAPT